MREGQTAQQWKKGRKEGLDRYGRVTTRDRKGEGGILIPGQLCSAGKRLEETLGKEQTLKTQGERPIGTRACPTVERWTSQRTWFPQ